MRYLPLPSAGWNERMDTLRFGFLKWDLHVHGRNTVLPGALVLTRGEHEEAVRLAEGLAGLAQRARRRLWAATAAEGAKPPEAPEAPRATLEDGAAGAAGAAGTTEAAGAAERAAAADALLGLPPAVASAARAAPTGPGLTRIDLFRTADGWVASEFNDDVPGGHNDAIGLPAVLEDLVPAGLHVPGDLPDALVRLLAAPARRSGLPLALLHATGYAEDRQVVELVARLLSAAGVEAIAASPAHLEWDEAARTAHVLGQPVAGAYRFFPAEWFPALPNWGAWQGALRGGFSVTNDLAWAFTQSKAVFAWLQREAGRGEDAGPVGTHAGSTRRVGGAAGAAAGGPGDAVDAADGGDPLLRALPWTAPLDEATAAAALERPERYVLKPSYGRVGEGVVLGDAVAPPAWRKRVAQALRARRQHPFVVQERFHAVPVEVAPGDARTACVGAYVADGRFAGYYSRLARGPLVAYDAANLLTLVEDA